ncbi:SAM-dependent methyltransferase [Amycolatopsis anabasis]|uniref:SAM-dependent methyltransferase n=1 Tax=Amycolatopsis anabasis TaxID=1840409 RepID=UPI00131D8AE1|nr:SAM-dependent methyltransferase [Amycolatopsis anabasis]
MTDSSDPGVPYGVDLDRPNAARVYDYLLGGTANWAIDRAFGDQVIEKLPLARTLARVNRDYLGRAVRYCARNGITQFLDLGSGVPTVGNVHEAADSIHPDSRCVYVDNEPVAVAHAKTLLERKGDPARHAAINADLRDVLGVWKAALATGVLDPDRPIGLILVAVLHFVPPEQGAAEAVSQYRELLAPGSHLIISHGTDEGIPESELSQMRLTAKQYEESSTPVHFRTKAEVAEFFGDFELVEPGLVWLPEWRLDEGESRATRKIAHNPPLSCVLGGVGRKP